MAKHGKVSFDHLAKQYKIDSKELKSILIEAWLVTARNKKVDLTSAGKILDEYVGAATKSKTKTKNKTKAKVKATTTKAGERRISSEPKTKAQSKLQKANTIEETPEWMKWLGYLILAGLLLGYLSKFIWWSRWTPVIKDAQGVSWDVEIIQEIEAEDIEEVEIEGIEEVEEVEEVAQATWNIIPVYVTGTWLDIEAEIDEVIDEE